MDTSLDPDYEYRPEILAIVNPNPRKLLVYKPGISGPCDILMQGDQLETLWQPGMALATESGKSKVVLADCPDGDQWVMDVGQRKVCIKRPFDE